jgi:aspartate/methionine/tyrosine aminotransferase
MRRSIVHEGAGQLTYEIREIVAVAKKMEAAGLTVTWENIGDPIQKGEAFPGWMKGILAELVAEDASYAYSDTQGIRPTRQFLADRVNDRGGCRITADDIMFFNGLGDAVAKIFGFLKREARVIGPSPAYSTLSSAEAAHSGYEHLTYRLDPDRGWLPDLDDLENKVRYNDAVAGLLLINPDNPTGVVYERAFLERMVDIARRYGLFVIADETYANITYNGGEPCSLSQVLGGVPGLSLRSISKEYPWPGARCGWIEVFNKEGHPEFRRYIDSLLAAKRLEVCSTSLPQLTIPRIMGDPRYSAHLERRRLMFGDRAREAFATLDGIPGAKVVLPQGSLYFTVLFEPGVLEGERSLPPANPVVGALVAGLMGTVAPDKRFVYQLLASTGICTVPLTGFCSDLPGFRMTLLEADDKKRRWIFQTVADALRSYLA